MFKLSIYLGSGFMFAISYYLLFINNSLIWMGVLEKYQKGLIKQGEIENGK